MLTTADKQTILDFYILVDHDDALGKSTAAVVIGQILSNTFTLKDWADNALRYHSLTKKLRRQLESIVSR